MNSTGVPVFHREKFREIALILGVLLFLLLYKVVPPVNRLVDLLVDPAVAGITVAYSSLSTAIHRYTGLNLGFVQEETDQDFLFSVRLATYINERQAKPLLELATDQRVPEDKRERALRSLLKFQSTADWIQPFLNELPKGGMLGLYDKKTPVLDELMKKVRAEGGLRQPLVRAYAEVVFSFMMQVPDAVIRSHALRWVSDVIAEDSLFLVVPRIDKEQDPDVQTSIEVALLDIRAVSDPDTAREMLVPFYKRPPWPSLRFPLAVVLTRLGHENAAEYLRYALKNERLSESEQIATRVALAKTRYPKELSITEQEAKLVAQRAAERRNQYEAAMQKRERMIQQERMKRAMLARRVEHESGTTYREPEESRPEEESRVEQTTTRVTEPVEEAAAPVEEPKPAPARRRPAAASRPQTAQAPEEVQEPAVPRMTAEEQAAADRSARLAAAIEKRKAVEEAELAQRTAETQAREAARKQPAAESKPPAVSTQERPRFAEAEPVREARLPKTQEAPELPPPAPAEERVPPKPFSIPGELTPEERAPSRESAAQQLARLPEDVLPPPLEEQGPRSKQRSLMNYVDVVFEAKQDVPIFQNPGEKSGESVTMPKGTKGKADFEVMIGDERWLQVKTKKGNGWVEAGRLSTFNLRPDSVVPAAAPAAADSMEGPRKEATYFEPTIDDVPVYSKPSEGSKVVGRLKMDTVYLAVKSTKVGPNRWFLLQLRAGENGWVLGDINLQLANVLQPNQMVPSKPMSLRNKESWFAAGWVTPSVRGVGVYERSSMGSELLMTIDPPEVFRVLETNEGGGSEWYRIQISGKRLGWVQAMDVKATKEPGK